jgi:hypothetical protein
MLPEESNDMVRLEEKLMTIKCTKENPWKPEYGFPVVHEGAQEVPDSQENGWPAGDIVRMQCRDCGATWKEELPQ